MSLFLGTVVCHVLGTEEFLDLSGTPIEWVWFVSVLFVLF